MSILLNFIKSVARHKPPPSQDAGPAKQTVSPQEAPPPLPAMMEVSFDGGSARFSTPNDMAAWRVATLFTKEPGTIDWIGEFQEDEVLVDVGANVGMYSIWAALTRKVRVYAFEPESQNYAILNHNIFMNQLSGRIVAYCAALSDQVEFSLLNLGKFGAAGSCHAFGEKLNFQLQPFSPSFTQGAYSATLDSLVEAGVIPCPNHIKIDVDGFEHKVMTGARRTVQNPMVRSVLIEINQSLDLHRQIIENLSALGFCHDPSETARAVRMEGTFKGVGNYVFRR